MQIIWINDHPLIICHHRSDVPSSLLDHTAQVQYFTGVPADIRLITKKLGENVLDACVIETEDIPLSFELVSQDYDTWEAGGGLVTDTEGNVLLIFRRGKWDLPKGKLDKGESIETCALREVSEETGLHSLSLKAPICETRHVYALREQSKKIIKHTHWFRISFSGNELTVPQIEEDIVDIQWIRPDNIAKYLRFSYANIRYVFREAGYPV